MTAQPHRSTTTPPPLQRQARTSGTSSSVGAVATAFAARHRRSFVPTTPCERCRGTGIIGYSFMTGDEYCPCEVGSRALAQERQRYAEIEAEQRAWYLQRINERLAAFSTRHRLGEQIPTLEGLVATGHQQEALPKVQAFQAGWDGEQWVLLFGGFGVGKTMLALALVQSLKERLVAERRSVRIATVPDLLSDLRAGFDPVRQEHREGYAEVLEAYRTCGLLVLDDLGAERITEWVAEQFFLILDHRARKRLPVFLTSNHSPAELSARLEERVMERLRECATGLEVKGPNLRDGKVQLRAVQRGIPRS